MGRRSPEEMLRQTLTIPGMPGELRRSHLILQNEPEVQDLNVNDVRVVVNRILESKSFVAEVDNIARTYSRDLPKGTDRFHAFSGIVFQLLAAQSFSHLLQVGRHEDYRLPANISVHGPLQSGKFFAELYGRNLEETKKNKKRKRKRRTVEASEHIKLIGGYPYTPDALLIRESNVVGFLEATQKLSVSYFQRKIANIRSFLGQIAEIDKQLPESDQLFGEVNEAGQRVFHVVFAVPMENNHNLAVQHVYQPIRDLIENLEQDGPILARGYQLIGHVFVIPYSKQLVELDIMYALHLGRFRELRERVLKVVEGLDNLDDTVE